MTHSFSPQETSTPEAISDSGLDAEQATELAEARQLILWLESHPNYADLVEQARQDRLHPPAPVPRWQRPWRWSWQRLKPLLVAKESDLHGNAFVSNPLQGDAKIMGGIITVSNLINVLGTAPLLDFSLSSLVPIGRPLAILLTVLLLKLSNDTASAVARGKQGSRSWAYTAAAIGYIPLSVLMSMVAGISTELLNNRSALVHVQAEALTDTRLADQRQYVQSLENPAGPIYQTAADRCTEGEAALSQLPRSNSTWNMRYVQLYGSWQERNQNWDAVPTEQLPVCRRRDRLEEESRDRYQAALLKLDQTEAERLAMNNDLLFLEQHFPNTYNQYFRVVGWEKNTEFRSGVEAVTVASEQVIAKMLTGQWTQLGLSLFMMTLSVVSSAVACVMVYQFSRREDVERSWSEALQHARDQWLMDRFSELVQLQEAERHQALQALDTEQPNRLN
ncbi:hypothetical protein GS597_19655 [Synechococcales cyanobacterium C]|uniref:Uncharacterized protein n=1 Tax=Petrachloros mirabilis ULC683 TaxID=2781853 RepID=A0A8K2A2M0_9CYAN|nr:hypothetical protein [Petrachloros mirabilis]NCJ08681.1 hypothetical protein [Petrachloros mirabilis ULC683]